MLSSVNKYPFFDLADIKPELEFSYKKYQPLNPVKVGNYVPFDLDNNQSRWQQFYNGAQTRGLIVTQQLLSKPLVIAFYSHHWGGAGVTRLIELNAIHTEVRANGGNLLVITTEKSDSLEKIAWEQSLTLNFYVDTANEVAQKFRVYAENSPTWNIFSGIDVNIPLLATYVIDESKHVVYQHVNRNLEEIFSAPAILSAVYHSALAANSKKSA
ncbi:MAG: redoxin domain-containing protein [Sphingobacteriales bacterium]|nr:MAG: redoxin domain-containing protein [Sphingobacteriales bacterium]